jgi:hypothetical protein
MANKLNARAVTGLSTIARMETNASVAELQTPPVVDAVESDSPATENAATENAIESAVTVATDHSVVARGNTAIANITGEQIDGMLAAAMAKRGELKAVNASGKNVIRALEVVSIAWGLHHLLTHHNKGKLSEVISKAKGLSAPIKNALRVIIPALKMSNGMVTYDVEGDAVEFVTLDSGKVSIRPIVNKEALAVFMFQARRVALTPSTDWNQIDILSESWKATFPVESAMSIAMKDVVAWREKQVKALVKQGIAESAARAFIQHQTPAANA